MGADSSSADAPHQLQVVTALTTPSAASHAVEQQEVQSTELGMVVVGQKMTCEEEAPTVAAALGKVQRSVGSGGVRGGGDLSSDAARVAAQEVMNGDGAAQ